MIYMFLAQGFEEVEALSPLDLLRRAGADIKTVGIGGEYITGAHGITVKADISEDEVDTDGLEMVILPGGMPGTKNLDSSRTVHKALDAAKSNGAYVAAICAAPMILGKRGELKGKKAVCYPGFEEHLLFATVLDEKVAVDGRTVTAKGMGAAVEFGLTLVSLLYGKEKAEELRLSTISY